MLSPDNRTQFAASRISHRNVDATDLLKHKKHHRRKSETDFPDKEQKKSDAESSENAVPYDCMVSLEELNEAATGNVTDAERVSSEEQKGDSGKSISDNSEKMSRQIKRHTSLTSLGTPSIARTPPISRLKGYSQHQSSDGTDYHNESMSLLSPVKATENFTTKSPMPEIMNALTNEE